MTACISASMASADADGAGVPAAGVLMSMVGAALGAAVGATLAAAVVDGDEPAPEPDGPALGASVQAAAEPDAHAAIEAATAPPAATAAPLRNPRRLAISRRSPWEGTWSIGVVPEMAGSRASGAAPGVTG
jgi:hypothetical protein